MPSPVRRGTASRTSPPNRQVELRSAIRGAEGKQGDESLAATGLYQAQTRSDSDEATASAQRTEFGQRSRC